jgi:hypothetical protein
MKDSKTLLLDYLTSIRDPERAASLFRTRRIRDRWPSGCDPCLGRNFLIKPNFKIAVRLPVPDVLEASLDKPRHRVCHVDLLPAKSSIAPIERRHPSEAQIASSNPVGVATPGLPANDRATHVGAR